MRTHIPDTWAFFFGIIIVHTEAAESIFDFTEPIGIQEFIDKIDGVSFKVDDPQKYRQRLLFVVDKWPEIY